MPKLHDHPVVGLEQVDDGLEPALALVRPGAPPALGLVVDDRRVRGERVLEEDAPSCDDAAAAVGHGAVAA